MNPRVRTEKVHVPPFRGPPPAAAWLGSLAVRALGGLSMAGWRLSALAAALKPASIRAELAAAAATCAPKHPGLASRLRSVSHEAWDH